MASNSSKCDCKKELTCTEKSILKNVTNMDAKLKIKFLKFDKGKKISFWLKPQF